MWMLCSFPVQVARIDDFNEESTRTTHMHAITVDITSDVVTAATLYNIILDTATVTSGLFEEQQVNSNGTVLDCGLPNPRNLCFGIKKCGFPVPRRNELSMAYILSSSSTKVHHCDIAPSKF